MEPVRLRPLQEEIRDELLLVGQELPVPDRSLAVRLRQRMGAELADTTQQLPRGHRVWVNKHRLGYVFACEGYLRARDAEGWTGWNIKNARGRVAHRAMEGLIMSSYERPPLDLAQSAIDYLAQGEDDFGDFLRGLEDGQRQDLVRDANNLLVRFRHDWPPIEYDWSPTVECRSRVSFGPATLDGVADLALRIPSPSTTRTFIVDFKTGMIDEQHRDDLRFYALVETLRSRTPPYRVATYYLDEGEYRYENVDETSLAAAVDRLIEGVAKIIHVERGEPPTLDPGTQCRYCSARRECGPGQEWWAIFGNEADA